MNSKRDELRTSEREGLKTRQHFIIPTLQQAAIQKKKKKKKSPELCRFVSEGEMQTVRSNRPLIFLSCIKGTVLLGGYAGEQALLIFTVYLMRSLHIPQ